MGALDPIVLSLLTPALDVTEVFKEFCILLEVGVFDLYLASAIVFDGWVAVLEDPLGVVIVEVLPVVAVVLDAAAPVVLPAGLAVPVVLVFFSNS